MYVRQLKEYFFKKFVKISAMAWWLMTIFNFSHNKYIESLRCHDNQTKEIIFFKNKKANMTTISTKSQPQRAYG